MTEPLEQFRLALAGRNIIPPADLIADGKLHRCDAEGRRGKNDASYILHLDEGVPAGGFQNWRDGLGWEDWHMERSRPLTLADKRAYQERVTAMRAQREEEEIRRRDEAAHKARTLWESAMHASEHGYLKAKGVKPHGMRVDGEALIVPMRDIHGTLHSLQSISPDGNKLFLSGGRTKECYCSIGKPKGHLIVCEGFATGASIHEATGHAVAVAFNAGNLPAVAVALHEKFPTMTITIAADDDHQTPGNPGLTKATEAAIAVGGMLATPAFPADRPAKATDFNDLHQISGLDVVRRCIQAARPVGADAWPVPEPLLISYPPVPYPVEVLPQTIRHAVEEVVGFVKAPISLAASSALAAVSVAVQGLYDVERAPGLKSPCSLYLLSIADSGERKTSCDGYFKQSLENWQQKEAESLKPSIDRYVADKAAWEAKKTGILDAIKQAARKNEPTEEFERTLHDVQREAPNLVRLPRLVRGDDTPENLGWALTKEWPSAGVLSSEAGVVFGSHGMSSDSVMRNLALLNVAWDGGSTHVGRRSSESYSIVGVRLTMGLQVQESTLRAFFDKSKGLARGTGFLARFLIAWPESTMGTRLYNDAPDWSKLRAFNQRVEDLLQSPLSIDDEGRLSTTTLQLSASAHAAWVAFQNEIELKLSPDGELRNVKDVASKVADNAARLATLFQVFEHGAGPISADAMVRGAKLAAWHLSEAQRFLAQFDMPVEWLQAERLERWLIRHCEREGKNCVSSSTALQYGPLRDKATLQAAVAHLEELGRVRIVNSGKKRTILVNPALLKGAV